jgi:Kef-type K+ transport system membrane component KefB
VNFLRLPFFFGFLLAGILLGPGGFIKNAVQVETISRGLGVIFIMFFLGLEFNMSKIKKVLGVSVLRFNAVNFSCTILLSMTVGFFCLMGRQYDRSYAECITIGASVFMSSTVVVLNFLDVEEMEFSYGRSILGILVMQDILLGFLLVLMPALQKSGDSLLQTLIQLISSLVLFLLSCLILRYPTLKIMKWLAAETKRHEIFLLGSIAFCLCVVYIGSFFKQSMELSCFVAGVMVLHPNIDCIGQEAERNGHEGYRTTEGDFLCAVFRFVGIAHLPELSTQRRVALTTSGAFMHDI